MDLILILALIATVIIGLGAAPVLPTPRAALIAVVVLTAAIMLPAAVIIAAAVVLGGATAADAWFDARPAGRDAIVSGSPRARSPERRAGRGAGGRRM